MAALSLSQVIPEQINAPDLQAFIASHGRFPRLGDEVQPWLYRGWLLGYVVLADLHPNAPGRWNHYLAILSKGSLIEKPIPQISFSDCMDRTGLKMIENCIEIVTRREATWSAFQVFVDWLAWALGVTDRIPKLEDDTNERLYRTFNLEPLLLHPHDFLGAILADSRGNGWNPHAFFPTPHGVCELMARMMMHDDRGPEMRTKSVMDPALGTARMLLHASNYSYNLYGCDIDPLVVQIAKINGALYAPWMTFPFPEGILGVPLPPPPPAPLPIPGAQQPNQEQEIKMLRCDDRGQGLDLAP